MRNMARFTSIVLGLAAGPVLLAQTTSGSLAGNVKSRTGGPIAGARVIITSKALFQPKTLTTDERGEWRALLLPPGEYDITAVKDGFVSSAAKQVRVGIGGSIRQDLSLTAIAEQSATVSVIAVAASGVDKADTKAATNFSAEELGIIATSGGDRGFNGALSVAPGVVSETPNGNVASIRGGMLSSTNYTVNGADIKDQVLGEVKGDWYVDDNIEDVQVVLSPLNARFGRAAGGSVNVVTKTGGNDFSGSIRANFSRQTWNAENSLFPVEETDDLQRSWNMVLSGPILKDRLWFNVATIMKPESANGASFNWGGIGWRDPRAVYATRIAALDAVTATDLTTGVPLAGSRVPNGYVFGFPQAGATFSQVSKQTYIEAKITGAISQNHVVEYAFMRSSSTKTNADPNDDLWHSVRVQTLGELETNRKVDTLTYRGALTNELFVEARYSGNETKLTKPQGDRKYAGGRAAVFQHGLGITDGVAYTHAAQAAAGANAYGYQPFGPWVSPTPTRLRSASYNVDLKWIKAMGIGSHEFDFGLDGYSTKYDNNSNFQTSDLGSDNRQYVIGGYYQRASDPTDLIFPVIAYAPNTNRVPEGAFGKWSMGLAPTMIQYTGPAGGTIDTEIQALYANDQWTINSHWSVMLGVRFETQKLTDSTGVQLAKTNAFSPRFQARYDVNGDSRNLFTFTAGEFQGDIPQGFAAAFATQPQSKGVYRGFNQIDGALLPTPGDPADNGNFGVRFVDWATVYNPANYGVLISAFDRSLTNIVDSKLKPPTMTEVTLGYSRSFESGSSVSITYVNRTWKDLMAIGQNYQPSEIVTITPDASYGIKSHFFNSSDLKRRYNSLETAFNIRTKGIWSVNGSWTYSRLTGNDEGGDDPTGNSSILQTNPTPLFYNNVFLKSVGVSSGVYAPDGRLLNDLTNRIRLGVTATIPLARGGVVTLSWMGHYADGKPFGSRDGNMPTYALSGWGMTDLTAGSANTVVGAGAGGQTVAGYLGGRRPFEQNGLGSVDFRVAFRIPVRLWRLQVFGDVTISNFFNHQDVGYNQAFTTVFSSDPAAAPTLSSGNFGQPGANGDPRLQMAPRTVAASLGLRF